MDRAKIYALIDVARSRGLEIGALNRPLVTRDMGPVEYVDRAPREELQRWYGGEHVDAKDIVEVDHIWGDQSLLECVGGQRIYDYVVASHVIEHVPDMFGWLGEIAAVLADGGLAIFAVPDKRYTFDVLRRTSSDAEFVDAYVRRLRRPDARQIFDCNYNFRDLQGEAIRSGAAPGEVAPQHPPRELLDLCQRVQESADYMDVHCWVFTPRSMVAALDLGSRLGLLPFEIARLEPTEPGSDEFLLVLRRRPDGEAADAQRAGFVASREALDLPEEESQPMGQDLRVLTAQAHFAVARAAAIEASTSWRITAPLRSAATLVRRLRGRR